MNWLKKVAVKPKGEIDTRYSKLNPLPKESEIIFDIASFLIAFWNESGAYSGGTDYYDLPDARRQEYLNLATNIVKRVAKDLKEQPQTCNACNGTGHIVQTVDCGKCCGKGSIPVGS